MTYLRETGAGNQSNISRSYYCNFHMVNYLDVFRRPSGRIR
jgi:hypothetical protein